MDYIIFDASYTDECPSQIFRLNVNSGVVTTLMTGVSSSYHDPIVLP
jgi:hypothetical protein